MRTTRSLLRTLSLAFTVAILGAASMLPDFVQAHDRIGANLNFIGDFRRNHEFADVLKQSRLFLRPGAFDDQDPANRAPIGTDGWPTADFRVLAMAAQDATQGLAGNYTITYTGPAGVTVTADGGAGSITASEYNPTTRVGRATLNFPAGGALMVVNFTNTSGQVKDVRILRPGITNFDNPPFLNAPWKAHVQRFPVIRYLDWTRTNGNRDISWADRVTPQTRRTEAYIAQWETVIEAANWLNRDAWINVPVRANDEYVRNLATLWRDRLNANLNLYVEYGNELWNFGIRDVDMDVLNGGDPFNGASVNQALANGPGSDSRLSFDGETNEFVRGFRRVGLRLFQISEIFKEVWGAAAINTRVRPVLAGQMANRFIVTEGLRMIDEGLNIRPNTVFYALSGAPYIFPSAIPDGEADEAPGLTADDIITGLEAGVANAPNANAYGYEEHAALGAWYGLKVVAYEAGFDNFGGGNIPAKVAANTDPRIRNICRNFIDQWLSFGFEQILWFNAGADGYDTPFGMWPLVQDIAPSQHSTPKNECMNDLLAANLPAVTFGTPVIGAPIAGGNFRFSDNPTGTLSGSAPDFGFPRYVEYLLRADADGTFQLVFNGSAPAGETFRVKLNNATVAASVQLPTTTGNASVITLNLRRGINALRIERVNGASWVVNSFTFTQTGDATPNAFSFAPKADVQTGSTVVSDPATITGITIAAPVSVTGGEYAVNCTAPFTAAAGTITNNQTICVRHLAAASAATPTVTILTIGGVSASFTSTTRAANVEPPQQQTLTVTNAGGGVVTSTPAGVNCGSTCTASFGGGTLVTLTATPNAGFGFAGWSGACVGTTACQVTMLGARSVTAVFQANVTLTVSLSGGGSGTVTSSPAGINCSSGNSTGCTLTQAAGASVTLTAAAASGSAFTGWSGACAGASGASCVVALNEAKTARAEFQLSAPVAAVAPQSLTFANQAVGSASGARTLSLSNAAGGSLTVTSVTSSNPQFAATQSCGALAGGASCTVSVRFTPSALGLRTGLLTIVTNGGTRTVELSGTGVGSQSFSANASAVVTGYYETILGRSPDQGGLDFWTSEATRVSQLGADVREVFYALSITFFSSPEYVNRGTSNEQYIRDLYRTFFIREPDTAGLNFWLGELNQVLSRSALLNSFLFSSEFSGAMTALFGNPPIRPEVNLTMDLFRGVVGRLPDNAGFNFWLGQIRAAQCQGGNAVNTRVTDVANQFFGAPEYGQRNRNNRDFMGDVYNTYLRRGPGGDTGGFNFWVGEITPRGRDGVRGAFVPSAEFQARVTAIVNAGCAT